MSKQSFGDESNWKHEPHSEHYVKDKFGKGTETRNWKKNLDPNVEEQKEDLGDVKETDSEMEDLEEEIKLKKDKAEERH
jgi:DnaK suppressor protein